MLHRDSQKRYYISGAIYFVTFNTKDWFPYFKETLFCDLFIEELRLCKQLKGFKVYGFVVMPDHVHLLVRPGDACTISEIMRSLKTNFSRNCNMIMQQTFFPMKARSRDRAFEEYHDGTLANLKIKLDQKYPNPSNHFPKFAWHKSYYDHIIRDEDDLHRHIEYIWWNPVKHGLVDDSIKYRYVSLPGRFDGLVNFFN